jgi:UDP-N-acetylglucosamine 2-epimerase (non-hydrolysing)
VAKGDKKLLIVVGTRPNFIKVTRFKSVAAGRLNIQLLHTGQHYDRTMSGVFFEQFGLIPDCFLNITAGSANTQMAEIMKGLEEVIAGARPDMIMVVGDVNSTLAGALTANKLGIPLAHLESGLRSFDRSMPEEVNRILTDEITDHFFITEESGTTNLVRESKDPKKLHFVGNTMIDTLVAYREQIDKAAAIERLGLKSDRFSLMTIHRPATVDSEQGLKKLLDLIQAVGDKQKIVFPVHPRTVSNLKRFGLELRFRNLKGLIICDPMDYFSFQQMVSRCSYILTDSGGIQEESTFLGKPCLTLRPNTERPSTVEVGTNTLLPFDNEKILNTINAIEEGWYKKGSIPEKWDGRATERIVDILEQIL